MAYTELTISAKVLDQSTDRLVDIQDSIPKKNFWLVTSMEGEKIAQQALKSWPTLGFHSVNALDCEPPTVYEDLINRINITMIDPNNISPNKVVSELFGYPSADGKWITYLEDYLQKQTKYEPENYFQLTCLTPDSLYDEAQFSVEVILASKKVFTKTTESILFKN
jgi:hypothetical protein